MPRDIAKQCGLVIVTASLLATSPAGAASLTAVLGEADYELRCNANGYVIRLNPLGIAAIEDAIGRSARGGGRVYLGRSCDAASDSFGAGKWCLAAGGFLVDLEGVTLDFPEQRPACRPIPNLGEGCLC